MPIDENRPSEISDSSESQDIEPEFYELIGRAASDLAWLEMMVNDCLWALSGTPYGAGACITAQIYTFDSRMKALIALLRLKKVDTRLIKRVNAFHEDSRKASVIRNRIIHDMWGHKNGEAYQLTVTADKNLKFEIIPRKIDDLRAEFKTVVQTVLDFQSIRDEIGVALLTLPNTRPLALQATYTPHDPTQNQSKQTQSPTDPPRSSSA